MRKLGLKPGQRLCVLNPPKPYSDFFPEPPEWLSISAPEEKSMDFIHLFARSYEQLEKGLERSKSLLDPKGMIWVSWPKKSSNLESEIGKFDVMLAGQALGLVDVKVASLDETWSGHKFVIPVKDRPAF